MILTGLPLYNRIAHESSARVIHRYSTSFGLASRLLDATERRRIADVYALVRVADEIVDGPGAQAGLAGSDVRAVLDDFERETLAALSRGFSANLVAHAFALTARETGIGPDLVLPFFSSMRMDIESGVGFDDAAYRRYIHGSAEVVGSMCLRVFAQEGLGIEIDPELDEGARRLGAAFQKVNFLRDLADDSDRLGRRYLPGASEDGVSDAQKDAVAEEIDEDLRVARRQIRRLPPRSRRATFAAADLFGCLNARLRAVSAAELRVRRVSVPTPAKARILVSALVSGARA